MYLYPILASSEDMDSEALHVSQLYESVATFGVLVILIAEILIAHKQLSSNSISVRFK